MTAAELAALLPEVDGDARVRIIGANGAHDIFAAYMGVDRDVYIVLAALPETVHNACGSDACCGTC